MSECNRACPPNSARSRKATLQGHELFASRGRWNDSGHV
ncbi:hypothetical protein JL2886_00964 [Phaeobacter gallaeciensis]|uniref:Uncharacterized protein n=1 Tax=Phaeobacter gallaeciensis TaxID=60890 RepID=A0A1B0ZNY4_9RHOB|nr:hypothetical protein JL2886_00964 [Phaeobacter gallaeciensis]